MKLRADPGHWDADPWGSRRSSLSFTYQWKRDGKDIKGAGSRYYKVTNADLGKRLSCTVTAKKSGYATAVVTSKATPKVALWTMKVGVNVYGKVDLYVFGIGSSFSPAPKVGRYTTYTIPEGGALVDESDPEQVKVQWLLNGKPVSGVTKSPWRGTFLVKKSDAGKKLTLRVTYKKVGYKDLVLSKTETIRR
jgi:arabinogalactan endo-1,4-beta-galactosidase